jgi:hypothetical protein
VNVRPDVMFCSLAFEYLVFHAVNRRLGVFVSPVERSSHRASVHASWSTTGVLGATALDGLQSNESRSGLQRSTATD